LSQSLRLDETAPPPVGVMAGVRVFKAAPSWQAAWREGSGAPVTSAPRHQMTARW
jgi:hypothetical protein